MLWWHIEIKTPGEYMHKKFSPTVDLHVHTVASGHAYSTISEIAAEASRKGLQGVGMTDHGPMIPGGPHLYHFLALRFLPATLSGVRILKGAEANIVGIGMIDLPQEITTQLDVVMAGFHEECGFGNQGKKENTRALLAVMENPHVKIITHPGNPLFPLDYKRVVQQAVATGTALEINNASFSLSRCGSSPNCREIIRLCAHYEAPVALGSDAHFSQGVGEFAEALQMISAGGIHPEQIVNLTLESTLRFLGLRS